MLPVLFIAAASRLLFWRAKLNYAEHLILCCYLVGHVMLFFAVVLMAVHFTGRLFAEIVGLVVLGLGAGYIAWAYSRFFDRRPLLAAAGGLVAALGGTALFLAVLVVIGYMLRAGGII